ncbi:Putative protein of unknown function [Podospora comata]|uniref:Uncharacterized protein n=1 Tax=Podospora comata TaxID=48703 RepID=A0ABY6SBY7_PODCO|nr:Putative protein of unknown function [Podospora comata]
MRRAEPKMLTVLLQYCFGYRVGIHPWSRVRMPPEASSLGMAGREAAERRHSLQAMRSRRSDKRPTAGCWDQWRRRDVACMAQKTKLFRMRVPSPDHFSCLWSRGEATPTDSTLLMRREWALDALARMLSGTLFILMPVAVPTPWLARHPKSWAALLLDDASTHWPPACCCY